MLKDLLNLMKKHHIHYFLIIIVVMYAATVLSSTHTEPVNELPHSEVAPRIDQSYQ